MRAGPAAAIVAASLLGAVPASAACPPGQSRNCVNLDLTPQISQQVVAGAPSATPKAAPRGDAKPAYSGPIVGLSPTARPTPTVGYRWSLD